MGGREVRRRRRRGRRGKGGSVVRMRWRRMRGGKCEPIWVYSIWVYSIQVYWRRKCRARVWMHWRCERRTAGNRMPTRRERRNSVMARMWERRRNSGMSRRQERGRVRGKHRIVWM